MGQSKVTVTSAPVSASTTSAGLLTSWPLLRIVSPNPDGPRDGDCRRDVPFLIDHVLLEPEGQAGLAQREPAVRVGDGQGRQGRGFGKVVSENASWRCAPSVRPAAVTTWNR